MAKVALNTYIKRAIYGGYFFTKTDEKRDQTGIERQYSNQEAWNNRFNVIDSPNNIDGIIISLKGIYVVRRFRPMQLNKQTGEYEATIKSLVYTDSQNNKDFYNAVRTCDQIGIANSWASNPTIQNIRYIILDDIVLGAINRSPNYTPTNLEQMKAILAAVQNRDQFPLLYKAGYMPHLYNVLDSFNNKELTQLNDIVKKNRESGQKCYGDDYEALMSAFCARATELDQQHRKFQALTIDLDKQPGFPPARSFMDRVVQADIYKFDEVKLLSEKQKNQEQKKIEIDKSKLAAKADENRPGLTKLREYQGGLFDDAIDKKMKDVYDQYIYAFQSGYEASQYSNYGILRSGQVIKPQSTKGNIEYDPDNNFDIAYKVINESLQSKDIKIGLVDITSPKNETKYISEETEDNIKRYYDENLSNLSQYIRKIMNRSSEELSCLVDQIQLRFVKQYKRNTFNMIPESFWDSSKYKDVYNEIKQDNSSFVKGEKRFNATVKLFIKTLTWYIVYDCLTTSDNSKDIVNGYITGNRVSLSNQDRDVVRAEVFRLAGKVSKVLGNIISVSVRKGSDNSLADICYRVTYSKNTESEDTIANNFRVEYAGNNNITAIGAKCIGQKGKAGIKIQIKESDGLQTVDILDWLKNNNEQIQFQHVLLGEDLNSRKVTGDHFTDNNTQYMVYALYAGTGAGKGNMTNNLLAHAIASKCKIAYIDGKPDTGVQLGDLAWRKGKEAFVFDGAYTGSQEFLKGTLEHYSCGIRLKDERKNNLGTMPRELIDLLNDKAALDDVLNATRYIRCMQLIDNIVRYRGSHKDDNRFVVVFDECRKMAQIEAKARKALDSCKEDLVKRKKKRTDPDGDGLRYMEKWHSWADNVGARYESMATVDLRSSNSTLFFIFQGQLWLKDKEHGGTIQNQINSMVQIMSKIIGCGGIEPYASGGFGNTDALNQSWGQIVEQKKMWVKTGSTVNIQYYVNHPDEIRPFKPYTLYGNNDFTLNILNQYRNATITEIENEIKNRCDNREGIKELANYRKQMQYFAAKLEEYQNGQLNVADVLQQAYTYGEDIVKQFGYNSLKEYVYQIDLSRQSFEDGISSSGAFIPGQNSSDQTADVQTSQAVGDVTRDATSKEKKSTGSTQPGSVRLTGSTEEERLQQAMFMGVDTTNMRAPSAEYTDARRQQPQQQSSPYQQNPYARTANDRAIQQDMAIDDPDIGQAQQGYFSEDQNGNTVVGDQNYGEGGELLTKDNYIPASKRAKTYGGALLQSFTMFVSRNQPFSRRQAVCRAVYALKINDLLIDEIENSVGGWGYVKTLAFTQDKIMVNGKRIDPHDYLQDGWGNIDLQLAINAGKIIKRFKNLQSLQFDDDAYYKFFDQLDVYEENRIRHVFDKLKQLRNIQNTTTGVVINRHEGLRSTYSEPEDQVAKKSIALKAKNAVEKKVQEGVFKKGINYAFGDGFGTKAVQMLQLGIGFFIGGPIIGLTALAMSRKAMTKAQGQPQNGNTNRRNNNNTYRPMLG